VARYAIGVDFGTASGRAILVDVADGRQLATAVSEYSSEWFFSKALQILASTSGSRTTSAGARTTS
jgi:hypothetical protein